MSKIDINPLIAEIQTERNKVTKVYTPSAPYDWCIQTIRRYFVNLEAAKTQAADLQKVMYGLQIVKRDINNWYTSKEAANTIIAIIEAAITICERNVK